MKVSLVQAHPKMGDKAANLDQMEKVATESASDLVVFPELYLTGYMIRDDVKRLAEPIDGPSVKEASRIAQEHGKHIIFGMPEKVQDPKGYLRNTAVLAHPDGKVDRYSKFHIITFGPFEEHSYFTPGTRAGIFDTKLGRIGLEVCYDLFFPELTKLYAMSGCDVLVNISASPSVTRQFFEQVIPTRAIENTAFFLYTNLVGTEINMVFWGGARAIGPRGAELARGPLFEEGIVDVELDMSDLEVARQNRTTLRDSRPEVFEAMRELVEKRRIKGP